MQPIRKSALVWSILCTSLLGTPAIANDFKELKQTGTLVKNNTDDGTEVNKLCWLKNGFCLEQNYLGRRAAERYDVGLRFPAGNLDQGEKIAYARLRFSSMGSEVCSPITLRIEGVLQENPTTFSNTERPSQKNPKTRTRITWEINDDWDKGCIFVPLYYSSPDIAPILNEILFLPNWGSGPKKSVIVTLSDASCPGTGYVKFFDYKKGCSGWKQPPRLEIFKTVYDTFLGKELPARITDASAVINVYSLLETDTYVEYGIRPGVYTGATAIYLEQPAEKTVEIKMENLLPNTRYYYRLRYRRPGNTAFEAGEERTFHTQRSKGSFFTFSITSDEHIQLMHKLPQNFDDIALYEITLQNMAKESPDFHISLGDFAINEFYLGRDTANMEEGKDRYLLGRSYLNEVSHSIPFYLVLGNHEGELGWDYYGSACMEGRENLATMSALARKSIISNPYPDGFYTGNDDVSPDVGIREDYFAWEWGDALFVILDPFWYTRNKPCGCSDGWQWTLGKKQYDWLYDTLSHSDAKWKFIFLHHLVTTSTNHTPYYGRGGIEVAKYKVDGNPSFEWGGEDETGNYIFSSKRPGWSHGAIHDFLVDQGVSAVFHGHDHFFAKQDLDGIVYQMCPLPGDSSYSYVFTGGYKYGTLLPNSGHLQVSVTRKQVRVEYIRSYLPGDGNNGEVAYSYIIQ